MRWTYTRLMERPIDEAPAAATPAVIILADDLIWSTRLTALLRSIGMAARTVASLPAFDLALPAGRSAIVDLTARGYDGIEAVGLAAARGASILCLVQHDDLATRRAALAAGATRVVPYRTMHEHGPETLRRWLATAAEPANETDAAPAAVPAAGRGRTG